MPQQYLDLEKNVPVHVFPKAQKEVDRYWKWCHIWKGITLAALVSVILANVLDLVGITGALMVPTYFLALASMAIYIGYRVKYSKKWKNFLLKECNPGKELSVLWALLPKTSCVKSNLWSTHFYNVGITLFYAGRREDAEKIFPLFVKYCPDASGEFKYELLRMTIAFEQNNEQQLQRSCDRLRQLEMMVKPKGKLWTLYQDRLRYPMLIQLEKSGQYEELYHIWQQTGNRQHSRLAEVVRQFHLYRAAEAMGNAELAEQHKRYVLTYGGTLWYRTYVE